MSISKLSRKIPIFSFLKNPHCISNTFRNPISNIESFTHLPYNNVNSTFQSRAFTSFNDQFATKSLISRELVGFGRNYSSYVSRVPGIAAQEKKSKRTLQWLTGLVVGMVGLTYASVPLYRTFCQLTGYGGTVQRSESIEEKIARHTQDGTAPTRDIVVQFNADVSDGMQWKFIPTQREVRVKPGESALAFYTAENRSSVPITGVSSYNVTPQKAGKYFNKIQCFCFEEQCLLPGEQIDMPVFFYIDPEIETDVTMNGVNNIILSYTFFIAPEK